MQACQSFNAIKLVPRATLKALAKKVDGTVCYVEHFADVSPVIETSAFDTHVADVASVLARKTVCYFACVNTLGTVHDHELRTDGACAVGMA